MNFLEAVRIHFKLGLLIALLVPSIAWMHSLTVTPIFESKARLLIEAKSIDYERSFKSVARLSDPVQTQIEIIKSATILDKVIHRFNMRHKSGFRKGQYINYLELGRKLEISAGRYDDIVTLTYNDPEPKKAKNILQAITDSYIEKTIELKASDTTSAIRFLKKEKNRAEREALDTSKRLKEFEERSKIIDLDTNKEIVSASFALKNLRLTTETEYIKARTTSEQFASQLMISIDDALLVSTISSDLFLSALRKDLFDKETLLVQLQSKVNPGHYKLEETKEQIKGDKKLIEERIQELLGQQTGQVESIDKLNIIDTNAIAKINKMLDKLPKESIKALVKHHTASKYFPYSHDPLRAELTEKLLHAKSAEAALKEELNILDNAIKDMNMKLNKLPKEKYIYSQLLRQDEVAKKRLEEIEQNLIEAKLRGVIATHITNIRLIDPPSLASTPKSPDIPSTLFASLILGLFLASLVIYLVEYFDDVIKGIDTLPKEMGYPFLGQLPLVHIGDLPTVYQEPKSAYTESIHTLRTNISFLSIAGNKKLLLLTSSGISEGKSTVSINLAITYAQSGKRVLLIDSDIRNPSLYKYLSQPKDTVGLSNTLIEEIDFYDVIQKSILGIVGFDYLAGGDIPPNPVQLLESEKMRELLETSIHIYDLVIIDTPPIGIFSDALLLARYADIVAIVARHGKTSRKELMAAIDILNKTNVKALGVILNAVPMDAHSYSYYGYGYYGYGSERERMGESAA